MQDKIKKEKADGDEKKKDLRKQKPSFGFVQRHLISSQLVVAGSAFSIAPFVALRTRREKSPSPPVELERGSPSGVLTLLGPQHVKECTGNFVGDYPTHIGLIDSHPHHKMEMSLHFTCSELFYRTILYTNIHNP